MKKIIFALMLITPLLLLAGTSMGADRPDSPGIHMVQPQVVTMDDNQLYTLCEADYLEEIFVYSIVETPVFIAVAGEEPRSQEGSYPLKFSSFACVDCSYSFAETPVNILAWSGEGMYPLKYSTYCVAFDNLYTNWYSNYIPATVSLLCGPSISILLPGDKMHRCCTC